MAPWLLVWFVVGILSTVAVLACLIGLMRHMLVLARTVKQLQAEVQPLTEDLSKEGHRASTHVSAIGRRRQPGSPSKARG